MTRAEIIESLNCLRHYADTQVCAENDKLDGSNGPEEEQYRKRRSQCRNSIYTHRHMRSVTSKQREEMP